MNIYQINPLSGTENYAIWKIKMMDILMGKDLWKYTDGPTTQPSEVAPKVAWVEKDRMMLSMIQLWVADKMLVYVAGSAMSKEVWDALKGLLETQGVLRIVLVW
jgi:gag-polypeptide of LTR copia-type